MANESLSAIITGGAQGIGAAVCKALLKEGYQVCVADIQKEIGRNFVKEMQKEYGEGKVIFQYCNVAEEESFDGLFRQSLKAFGKIDVLMNNAGVGHEDYPKTIISTNLMSVIYGCKMAFRYMGKSNGIGEGGIVINMSSLAGLFPFDISPVYAATKHGIIGLTRSYGLPFQFEKEGIIFAAICPGMTNTNFVKRIRKYSSEKLKNHLLPNNMRPDYVAKGVLKILKDRINGSALIIKENIGGYIYVGHHEEFVEDH